MALKQIRKDERKILSNIHRNESCNSHKARKRGIQQTT